MDRDDFQATLTVDLKIGLPIGNKKAKKITLREPLLADMIDAESQIDGNGFDTPIAYRSALLCALITHVDGEQMAVTPEMLSRLKPCDYQILVRHMSALEALGESDASNESTTSAA